LAPSGWPATTPATSDRLRPAWLQRRQHRCPILCIARELPPRVAASSKLRV
jgi:hypothetical protein